MPIWSKARTKDNILGYLGYLHRYVYPVGRVFYSQRGDESEREGGWFLGFPQNFFGLDFDGGVTNYTYQKGRHQHWPSYWYYSLDVPNPTDMDGAIPNTIKGGGPNDERIWGLPTGCLENLNCPQWASDGQYIHTRTDSTGPWQGEHIFEGYEDPWTFYTVNQTYMTSGSADNVGEITTLGQAKGRKILSHTGVGVIENGYHIHDKVIDTAPGRKAGVHTPERNSSEYIPNNVFNMEAYGTPGNNSFFLNLTWYPRIDPNDTYVRIYSGINSQDTNSEFYKSNLKSTYSFFSIREGEKTRYTWIPQLARASGLVGGYLWHTMKHLGQTGKHPEDGVFDFFKRHSYIDVGVGKDGVGTFFNFTGEEAMICPGPGQPLDKVIQHSSGLVYTGHDISGTGGVNFTWSRQDFASGNFAKYLDDITNSDDHPAGKYAPSTGIVDVAARFFERLEPTEFYSGKMNWDICQDPFIARPATIQIKHKKTHRGSSHGALFIEPLNTYKNWDFDFTGFQMGDGVIGVHSGMGNEWGGLQEDNVITNYQEARRRGNKVLQYNIWQEHHPGVADGWYPITHFYHHDCASEQEFKDIYEYAPTKNWYTNKTGTWDEITNMAGYPPAGYGPGGVSNPSSNWMADYYIPAPFYNATQWDVGGDISNYDTKKDSVCYYAYIPMIAPLGDTEGLGENINKQHNIKTNNLYKACGHRFMSGIRSIGTLNNEEEEVELLSFTRNKRTVPTGGMDGRAEHIYGSYMQGLGFTDTVATVETGQITTPKFEIANEFGDMYAFHVSGWANYSYPQDKSKPIQFITGLPYINSFIKQIKPNVKKWFCPTDKASLDAAKFSQTQVVNIEDNRTPDIFKYKLNIISDSYALVDATPASPGPQIRAYNEEGNDILATTPPASYDVVDLGVGFEEGSYDLFAGDRIATLVWNGKIIDGCSGCGVESMRVAPSAGSHLYGSVTSADDGIRECEWAYFGATAHSLGPNYGCYGSMDLAMWSTGYIGYHYTAGDCSTSDPSNVNYKFGLATMPTDGTVGIPAVSEHNRYGQPEFSSNKNYAIKDADGRVAMVSESALYPIAGGGIEPSSETKEINFYLTHPNRGFVQFDVSEWHLETSENYQGFDYKANIGGEEQQYDYVFNMQDVYGYSDDIDMTIRGYRNWVFFRKWTIEPTIGRGSQNQEGGHAPQVFIQPYFSSWIEPTGHSWSEPWSMYGQVGGGYFPMSDCCGDRTEGGNLVGDGTLSWSSYNTAGGGGYAGPVPPNWDCASGPLCDARKNKAGQAVARYEERIDMHSTSKTFCPVVFYSSTGEVDDLIDLEPAADPEPYSNSSYSNDVYECPKYQMPFGHGARDRQQWPVVIEYSHYGNFPEVPESSNRPFHQADGVAGYWAATERRLQTTIYPDLHNENRYGFFFPAWTATNIYSDYTNGLLTKEDMTYTSYFGNANNFVLRLVKDMTYKVSEESYGAAFFPYQLDHASLPSNWRTQYETEFFHISGWAGGITPLDCSNPPTEFPWLLHSRTGYFQTNGTIHLDDNFKKRLLASGVAPENAALESLYQHGGGEVDEDTLAMDNSSGYISYQESNDQNICTFNVRSADKVPVFVPPIRGYVASSSGSFENCDASNPITCPADNCNTGMVARQQIWMPCWELDKINYDEVVEEITYKGMSYTKHASFGSREYSKSVLMTEIGISGGYEISKDAALTSCPEWPHYTVLNFPYLNWAQDIARKNWKAQEENGIPFRGPDYAFRNYYGALEHYSTLVLGDKDMSSEGLGYWQACNDDEFGIRIHT